MKSPMVAFIFLIALVCTGVIAVAHGIGEPWAAPEYNLLARGDFSDRGMAGVS